MINSFAIDVFALSGFEREQVLQRIKPLGEVSIDKPENPMPKPRISSKPVETPKIRLAADTIYKRYCAVCHRAGLAGAPKFRDKRDWQERLDNKGITGLTQSAIQGINAMPAMGTCTVCDADDIRRAVEYMVPHDAK